MPAICRRWLSCYKVRDRKGARDAIICFLDTNLRCRKCRESNWLRGNRRGACDRASLLAREIFPLN